MSVQSAYTRIIEGSTFTTRVTADTYAGLSTALNEKIYDLMQNEGEVEILSFDIREVVAVTEPVNKFAATARVKIKPEYRGQP